MVWRPYSAAPHIQQRRISSGCAFPKGKTRNRFLRIALGSIAEVGYGLHLAKRIGYLKAEDYRTIDEQTRMTAAPLRGLLKRALAENNQGS